MKPVLVAPSTVEPYTSELIELLHAPCVSCNDQHAVYRLLALGDDDALYTFCHDCACARLPVWWLLPKRFAAALASEEGAAELLLLIAMYQFHEQGRVPMAKRDLNVPERWSRA